MNRAIRASGARLSPAATARERHPHAPLLERQVRDLATALLIGLPCFHERLVPGVDGVRVVCLSLAERGGRIGLSFGRRVSRRPNESGQAKRGSPVQSRELLVEGRREDLAQYHRDERTALGKAHGGRAKEIERGERESYRRGLVDAERRAWAVRETMKERQKTRERERGPSIVIPVPRPPRPRGPERGGGGFER